MPPIESIRAKLKILLTTAKAAACVNTDQALSLLSSAKQVAIQWNTYTDVRHELSVTNIKAIQKGLLSAEQDIIDVLIEIVELEARIDRGHAIQSLKEFKTLGEHLSELDKSYAYFKIAQLEVNIGVEEADTALSLAKETFLKVTDKVRMEIFKMGVEADCLISLAWLEAPVCLERANDTLRSAVCTSSQEINEFYKRIEYIIVTLKGSAALNSQQQDIFTQLSNRFRQYCGIEEDEPAKSLFQYTMKIDSEENPLNVALELIASARLRASSGSEGAWNILKNVLDVMPTIACSDKSHFSFASPAYVVMRLMLETLRI